MDAPSHFIIVYQFGKVASTAIVDALNATPGIEAHQSHFLGQDALQRIMANAISRGVEPYFRQHMVGQLVSNLDLTYQINRIMGGDDDRMLTVVSLTREPLDWLRSSIQQDIEGYKTHFTEMAETSALGENQAVAAGIRSTLGLVADLLEQGGGVRHSVNVIATEGGPAYLRGLGPQDEFARRMLLLALRPLVWFDDHFAKCFGIGLNDLPLCGAYWLRTDPRARFVILRYEDIANTFEPAMQAAGVPFRGTVSRANVSRHKAYAAEVREAFDSPEGKRLGRALSQSDYAERFGYCAPEVEVTDPVQNACVG